MPGVSNLIDLIPFPDWWPVVEIFFCGWFWARCLSDFDRRVAPVKPLYIIGFGSGCVAGIFGHQIHDYLTRWIVDPDHRWQAVLGWIFHIPAAVCLGGLSFFIGGNRIKRLRIPVLWHLEMLVAFLAFPFSVTVIPGLVTYAYWDRASVLALGWWLSVAVCVAFFRREMAETTRLEMVSTRRFYKLLLLKPVRALTAPFRRGASS